MYGDHNRTCLSRTCCPCTHTVMFSILLSAQGLGTAMAAVYDMLAVVQVPPLPGSKQGPSGCPMRIITEHTVHTLSDHALQLCKTGGMWTMKLLGCSHFSQATGYSLGLSCTAPGRCICLLQSGAHKLPCCLHSGVC